MSSYTSGTAGLPSFGAPGTNFPDATEGFIVPAGNMEGQGFDNWQVSSNAVYWFAPGEHSFPGVDDQIQPADYDAFVGAPGAVLDGEGAAQTAFATNTYTGSSNEVTIEYLTIEDFSAGVGQAVVNSDQAADWAVLYNTVEGTTVGAAVSSGDDNTIEHNCLTENAEYGGDLFGTGVNFSDNEVSYNSLAAGYFPSDTSCGGCSGGAKFWATTDAVVEDNYFHDNGGVGLWFDTDNAGALIEGNYISRSFNNGLDYEISYNADITANTFVDNGWGDSTWAAGNVVGEAIYIFQSGGDPYVASAYQGSFSISGNTLVNNWDGIVIYDNSDRICSNNYTSDCTLDDPSIYTNTTCSSSGGDNTSSSPQSAGPPDEAPYDYYDYCQWKPEDITVSGNLISFNPAMIAAATVPSSWAPYVDLAECSASNWLDTNDAAPTGNQYYCGFNGMYAFTGSHPPIGGTWVAEDAIMSSASHNLNTNGEAPWDNTWEDNTYYGPQSMMAYDQDSCGAGQAPCDANGYPTMMTMSQYQTYWDQDSGSTSIPGAWPLWTFSMASLSTGGATNAAPPATTTGTPQTTTTGTPPTTSGAPQQRANARALIGSPLPLAVPLDNALPEVPYPALLVLAPLSVGGLLIARKRRH